MIGSDAPAQHVIDNSLMTLRKLRPVEKLRYGLAPAK